MHCYFWSRPLARLIISFTIFLDSINTQYLHNYYMHLLYNRNDGVEENHLFDIYTKCFYQVRAVLPLEMVFLKLA